MAQPDNSFATRPIPTGLVPVLLFAFLANMAIARTNSSAAAAQVRRRGPAISVSSSPTKISAGATAQFAVRMSKINPTADVTVNYTMAGTAVLGQDYSSPGLVGSITIPAGTSSATLSIDALQSSISTPRLATLRLQAGPGYRVSTPSRSSVTIMPTASASPTPSSTPAATATPSPTPTATPQEIWIAIRIDGTSGTGVQSDPYDGSTPEKFDAVMASLQSTPNLWIHLVGQGPFRTDARHSWHVGQGWVISGDGMYSTTLQISGNAAGIQGATAIWSDPNLATNNVAIRDLTLDCNWPELSLTATTGAGGEKDFSATAVAFFGSNNLLERTRCINSYGTSANHREHFAMLLCGSRFGDATNNIIRECRAELPHGTYGNPFALAGWRWNTGSYMLSNSKVIGSTVVGLNNGFDTGFTSGGVNLCNIKDCEIDGNTFIDCYGAAYIDTGSLDGLRVTNNTVIRGWQGVGLSNDDPVKRNILIQGNNFQIQNRCHNGGSFGVVTGPGATSNLTIINNTVTFLETGVGMDQFFGIAVDRLTNAAVTNNTIGTTTFEHYNFATGVGVTLLNNRAPDGSLVLGLN